MWFPVLLLLARLCVSVCVLYRLRQRDRASEQSSELAKQYHQIDRVHPLGHSMCVHFCVSVEIYVCADMYI